MGINDEEVKESLGNNAVGALKFAFVLSVGM